MKTDRDKLSFGFWSHLTQFNTKYKANAETFLTSDCTFTQWRVPWCNRRLFAGSCLLPITTLHKLVLRQTRYRYYAKWHPQYFSVIQNLFIVAHYTYENIRYGDRFWFLRSLYIILSKCSWAENFKFVIFQEQFILFKFLNIRNSWQLWEPHTITTHYRYYRVLNCMSSYCSSTGLEILQTLVKQTFTCPPSSFSTFIPFRSGQWDQAEDARMMEPFSQYFSAMLTSSTAWPLVENKREVLEPT